MAEVRLLRQAAADLEQIADYTVKEFGPEQAKSYGEGLLALLEALAGYPRMGSSQGHIRPGLRRFVYKSHAIYYRLAENGIVIQRILSPGRDPLREMTTNR